MVETSRAKRWFGCVHVEIVPIVHGNVPRDFRHESFVVLILRMGCHDDCCWCCLVFFHGARLQHVGFLVGQPCFFSQQRQWSFFLIVVVVAFIGLSVLQANLGVVGMEW